jgi:hypothetical protein
VQATLERGGLKWCDGFPVCLFGRAGGFVRLPSLLQKTLMQRVWRRSEMCLGFFDDPCTLQTCSHTFCKACILQPLMAGGATCPTCHVPARRYDLMARTWCLAPRLDSIVLNKLITGFFELYILPLNKVCHKPIKGFNGRLE